MGCPKTLDSLPEQSYTPPMPLATEEKTEILQLIRTELPVLLQTVRSVPNPAYEMEIRERIVRVEEELKHQREILIEGFKRMEEHFEAIQIQMDKRFEAVDKRFEAMQIQMDKRFEAMQVQMDKRFEAIDKRFEDLIHYVDKRFSNLQWTILAGFSFLSLLIGTFGLLAKIGFFQ